MVDRRSSAVTDMSRSVSNRKMSHASPARLSSPAPTRRSWMALHRHQRAGPRHRHRRAHAAVGRHGDARRSLEGPAMRGDEEDRSIVEPVEVLLLHCARSDDLDLCAAEVHPVRTGRVERRAIEMPEHVECVRGSVVVNHHVDVGRRPVGPTEAGRDGYATDDGEPAELGLSEACCRSDERHHGRPGKVNGLLTRHGGTPGLVSSPQGSPGRGHGPGRSPARWQGDAPAASAPCDGEAGAGSSPMRPVPRRLTLTRQLHCGRPRTRAERSRS